MSNRTCVSAALVLILALSGPALARTDGKRAHFRSAVVDPVSWLWGRISGLLKGGGGCDPNGGILCKPTTTITTTTDGGGGCDPNGSPRCTP
jgi:hypothetical protein